MKQDKSLALTQKDLNNDGIKTQLTQNDVLEVIVEEKYQEFLKKRDYYNRKRTDDIKYKYDNLVKNIILKACKSTVIKSGFVTEEQFEEVKNTLVINSTTSIKPKKYLKQSYLETSIYKNKETLSVYSGTGFDVLPDEKVTLTINLTLPTEKQTTNNITLTTTGSLSLQVAVNFTKDKEYKKFIDEVEANNKKVQEFATQYDGVDVSYNNMLRTIRTQFNKQLIKAGSPKLKQKLLEQFNISL